MSYHRIHGNVAFTCDGKRCHESIETDKNQFGQALADAREEGWISRQDGDGEWQHFCAAPCARDPR